MGFSAQTEIIIWLIQPVGTVCGVLCLFFHSRLIVAFLFNVLLIKEKLEHSDFTKTENKIQLFNVGEKLMNNDFIKATLKCTIQHQNVLNDSK